MPKTCSDAQTPWTRAHLHGATMGTRWSVTGDATPGLDTEILHQALAAAVAQVDAQMSPWKLLMAPETRGNMVAKPKRECE